MTMVFGVLAPWASWSRKAARYMKRSLRPSRRDLAFLCGGNGLLFLEPDTHKALHDEKDRSGGYGKTGDVDHHSQREGKNFLDQGVDRQLGVTVRADEEHIEGISLQQTGDVGQFIQAHGADDQNDKNGACLGDSFQLRLHIAGTHQDHTDRDHQTVADHGLDVDADRPNKHAGRIEHDADTGEEGIGSQISAKPLMDGILFHQGGQKADIHGSGTKLEGESVPGIIKGNGAAFVAKAEIDLLVDLKTDDKQGRDQQETADRGFTLAAAMLRDDQTCGDAQDDGYDVEWTVKRWCLHLRIQNRQDLCKEIQEKHLRIEKIWK